MSDKEYITIAEYAKLKNVSVSSVYKRLKTTLQPYSTIDESGKMALNREILEVEGIGVENPSSTFSTPKVENLFNPSSTPLQPFDCNFLIQQISEKDKQIERLQEELTAVRQQNEEKDLLIKENNQHIREQEKRLAELLAQAQQLNHNNQVLLLKEKEREGKGFLKRLFSKRDKGDTKE